jgi:hypothetical protein
VVLEVEDILKEFDESIERNEDQGAMTGDLPEVEAGAAGDTAGKDAQAKDAGTGNDPAKNETVLPDPQDADIQDSDEARAEEDQNDEASGPGDKKEGFFSKKKKKDTRVLEKQLEKVEEKAA